MVSPRLLRLSLLTAGLLTAGGCGGGPSQKPTYPVEGKVVYKDGSPVTGGQISFELVAPDAAGRVNATSPIGEDGSFKLGTYKPGDGALAGEHRVVVVGQNPNPDKYKGKPLPPKPVDPKFASYETSGLKVTVQQGKNDLKIEVDRPH